MFFKKFTIIQNYPLHSLVATRGSARWSPRLLRGAHSRSSRASEPADAGALLRARRPLSEAQSRNKAAADGTGPCRFNAILNSTYEWRTRHNSIGNNSPVSTTADL